MFLNHKPGWNHNFMSLASFPWIVELDPVCDLWLNYVFYLASVLPLIGDLKSKDPSLQCP